MLASYLYEVIEEQELTGEDEHADLHVIFQCIVDDMSAVFECVGSETVQGN
jgi:hypothetical protein